VDECNENLCAAVAHNNRKAYIYLMYSGNADLQIVQFLNEAYGYGRFV